MSPEAVTGPAPVVKIEGGRRAGVLWKLLRFCVFVGVVGGVAVAFGVAGIFA